MADELKEFANEIKRHFDVTAESLRTGIQQVAEGLISVAGKTERGFAEAHREFDEVKAMIKFSHAELARRLDSHNTTSPTFVSASNVWSASPHDRDIRLNVVDGEMRMNGTSGVDVPGNGSCSRCADSCPQPLIRTRLASPIASANRRMRLRCGRGSRTSATDARSDEQASASSRSRPSPSSSDTTYR